MENFNGQAVESWLLRMLANAREQHHQEIDWTFFCAHGKPGKLDDAVRVLGGTVIHSAYEVGKPVAFITALRQVLLEGNYDVLHCHQDIMSALPLLASVGLPLRRRIVHVHNTEIGMPSPNPVKVALLKLIFRQICLRADNIVGVSKYALSAMLGGRKGLPARDSVIHCGIETQRFHRDEAKARAVRDSFGFRPDAKILLFVGRMIAYKNPNFVLAVMEHLRQTSTHYAAVFAGVGPYEGEVRDLARLKGLADRVRVLGWRSDIPELMHASDLLIWPGVEEPKEGLGLGVVEAQAAGLPVLMSRNVPEEAVVVSELVKTMPLTAGPQAWAEAVTIILAQPHPTWQEALGRVAASSFAIEQSATNIVALYAGVDRKIH